MKATLEVTTMAIFAANLNLYWVTNCCWLFIMKFLMLGTRGQTYGMTVVAVSNKLLLSVVSGSNGHPFYNYCVKSKNIMYVDSLIRKKFLSGSSDIWNANTLSNFQNYLFLALREVSLHSNFTMKWNLILAFMVSI